MREGRAPGPPQTDTLGRRRIAGRALPGPPQGPGRPHPRGRVKACTDTRGGLVAALMGASSRPSSARARVGPARATQARRDRRQNRYSVRALHMCRLGFFCARSTLRVSACALHARVSGVLARGQTLVRRPAGALSLRLSTLCWPFASCAFSSTVAPAGGEGFALRSLLWLREALCGQVCRRDARDARRLTVAAATSRTSTSGMHLSYPILSYPILSYPILSYPKG